MKKIWAHILVKNEERFIWYSVTSVLQHVDKALIWDTGSTDKTVKIIKALKKKYQDKIVFKEIGDVTIDEFTQIRQQMLNETKCDWFLVVDGDEIWWDESIRKVVDLINKRGDIIESVVVPNINMVGDMYHHLEEKAGLYKLAGRKGHLALRAIRRNIPGLSSDKPHGTWGWVDEKGNMIQNRDPKGIIYIDAPYIHTTFLQRSGRINQERDVPKRRQKYKYDLGEKLPTDYYYPEAFFRKKPNLVSSIWKRRSKKYLINSLLQTPAKKLKRRVIRGKVGY